MNKIKLFEEEQQELFEKEQRRYAEQAKIDNTLTDDEKRRLDELKRKMAIDSSGKFLAMVQHTGGQTSELTVDEYLRSVDDNMSTMPDGTKLINASDDNFLESTGAMINTIKDMAYDQLMSMSVDENMSVERLNTIIVQVSDLCVRELKTSKITSDMVMEHFSKMTLKKISEIFPMDVIDTFTTEEERFDDPRSAKEKLVSIFSMMIMSRNEVDDLNQYLDNTEKVVNVLLRLEACGKDLAEQLKNPEKFSEIVAKTRLNTGEPTVNPALEKYAGILNHPNTVADGFAVKYVTMMELAEAYRTIKAEYTDLEEIKTIEREIEESEEKANRYLNVYHLTDFAEAYKGYETSAKTDKRTNRSRLSTTCKSYIEKIKKCKVNLNFPGYLPEMKTANEIYLAYVKQMEIALSNYNAKIKTISTEEPGILQPINSDPEVFAGVLLIVMGRLLKKLSKNTSNKFESLELYGYFQRFTKMAHNTNDVFTIWDVYSIIKPMIEYIENKK